MVLSYSLWGVQINDEIIKEFDKIEQTDDILNNNF
jgi:hypothetical protein